MSDSYLPDTGESVFVRVAQMSEKIQEIKAFVEEKGTTLEDRRDMYGTILMQIQADMIAAMMDIYVDSEPDKNAMWSAVYQQAELNVMRWLATAHRHISPDSGVPMNKMITDFANYLKASAV